METEVTKALEAAGVPFEVRNHSQPVFTCETAASERGIRISQVVKCMVGRSPEGQLFAMLLPGDRLLKLKKARRHAGVGIDLIPPDELAKDLGLTVGAISPVQLVEYARVLMDPTVLDEEVVDMSSGDSLAGVELSSKALRDLLQAEVVEIISTS